MIKSSELRVGNKIQNIKGTEFTVLPEDTIEIHSFPENYNGIPITEEWLLNIGLDKRSLKYYDESINDPVYIRGRYYVIFTSEGIAFCKLSVDRENYFLCHVKYIHELQNIYYSLTKEELQYD